MPQRLLLIFLAVFALSNGALAQERSLTLKEAIALAMKDNPGLRAHASSLMAVEEDIGIARSYLLPKITLEERFMRTTNPTLAFSSRLGQERFASEDFAVNKLNNPDAINDYQTSLAFEQPLFAPKAYMGLKMAKQEHFAKTEDYERKKEEVAFEIIKTYLMMDSAAEFLSAAQKGLEDAREHHRLSELRFSSDIGLYSDVLRASTLVTEAEQRLVTANKNINIAKRALGLLLGLTEPVTLTGGVPEPQLKEIEHYSGSSVTRADLKSMEIRYANARNNIDLARSDYLPMVGIGGAYMLNDHDTVFGSEGDSWQVSAFLRWNIFDGTLRSHETKKARHKAMEASEYLSGLKKAISFKIYEAYLNVEEAKKNAELTEAALKTAEEGERLVKLRYENGLAPIIDLLDAQVSLDNARANYVMKKNEYRSALANLSFESGTLLKDIGIE